MTFSWLSDFARDTVLRRELSWEKTQTGPESLPAGAPGDSPVVPVVTAVTADHGAPIIRLVASRADPDLVPPLISDLGFVQGRERKERGSEDKAPKAGRISMKLRHQAHKQNHQTKPPPKPKSSGQRTKAVIEAIATLGSQAREDGHGLRAQWKTFPRSTSNSLM